jgi:hypothetical protein
MTATAPDDWIRDLVDVPNPFSTAQIVGEGVSIETYKRQDAKRGDRAFIMSRGELVEFNTCPIRWRNGYREDGTKETEWGSLVDCVLLDNDNFYDRYAIAPAEYPVTKKGVCTGEMKPWNWNATFCDEWRAAEEARGKEVIKAERYSAAVQAVEVLKADEDVFTLLRCSKKQVMIQGVYHDADTQIDVTVRGLIDLLPLEHFTDSLVDLKTCNSAAPRPWAKAVYDYAYDQQAALYLDLYNAATGEDRNIFRHVIQESYPPYQFEKRMLSTDFIRIGRTRYVKALKRYCACLQSGVWTGYDCDETAPPNEPIIDGWRTIAPAIWMEAV